MNNNIEIKNLLTSVIADVENVKPIVKTYNCNIMLSKLKKAIDLLCIENVDINEASKVFKENNIRSSSLGLKIYIEMKNNTHNGPVEIRQSLLRDNPSLSLTTVYSWFKKLNKAKVL